MARTTSAGEERLLTVRELAERLNVPAQTIYGWRVVHRGPVGMRIGKYVRFRLEDVLAWEEANRDSKRTA